MYPIVNDTLLQQKSLDDEFCLYKDLHISLKITCETTEYEP